MTAPLALFAYDRPAHLARVLASLRADPLAAETSLHVFSDAPRDAAAAARVAQVREVLHRIEGFRDVTVVARARNFGVARSIIDGVGTLLARHGRVIVLEDDLLAGPDFLGYMNRALDYYETDERVVSVHAYSYPVRVPLPETFFLRGADCWGWGTWARGWRHFEPDGRKLLEALRERRLCAEFDMNGAYPYTAMLEAQIGGRNDSWAIRWHAAAFLAGGLTLYPGKSQVQNIGTDSSGVHVGTTAAFRHARWGGAVKVGGIDVVESAAALRACSEYLRGLHGGSLAARLRRRVANLAGRLRA